MGVDTAWVERVADAGAIDRGADGSFDPGDVHRVRLLNAFDAAGVPLDTLLAASRAGRISLRYYDELHPAPSSLSGRTYAEFAASLGDGRRYLAPLFAAFGIAEPDADVALTVDDEATIGGTLEVVVATGQPDLALRAVRMFGEGARRAADAALGIYGEAVTRLGGGLEGLPEEELFDRQLRPWARLAVRSGELSAWLAERHLSRAIDEYSIVESERILLEDGYVEHRLEAPPAVAFVDLTGFTRLTEERGDEVAAAVALRLGDLTVESVAGRGGRVVKLLGDGVLIRFDRAARCRGGDPRRPCGPARCRAAVGPRGGDERPPDRARRRRVRPHGEHGRPDRRCGARRPAVGARGGRGDVVARTVCADARRPGDAPGPRPGAAGRRRAPRRHRRLAGLAPLGDDLRRDPLRERGDRP